MYTKALDAISWRIYCDGSEEYGTDGMRRDASCDYPDKANPFVWFSRFHDGED